MAHLKQLLAIPGVRQRQSYAAALHTAVDVEAMDTSRDVVSPGMVFGQDACSGRAAASPSICAS